MGLTSKGSAPSTEHRVADMIEILHTNPRKDDKNTIKSKKRSSTISRKEDSFASELDRTISAGTEGSIEELMNDLRDHERKFVDTENFYELLKYKALVQKILKMAMSDSFATRSLKRSKKTNRADFTVIEKINSRLDEVTAAVTKGNKAFNLLKALDEIRGLIFDLVY